MDRMAAFELRRPKTLAEAAVMLAEEPAARILAGGTDLLPRMRRGIERPPVLVDLSGIATFSALAYGDEQLEIGAGATLARLAADERMAREYPAIAEAARAVGAPAHRIAATVGGNLCLDTRCVFYNQSEWWRAANSYCMKRGGEVCHVAPQGKHCHAAFCGDLAPALLVLGAEVELVSVAGTRRVPLADLYADDGAAHLRLGRGEVLARVLVPAASSTSDYRKARQRGAIDFPLAGVAGTLALRGGVLTQLRIALTGTNSRPFLLEGTADLLGRSIDDDLLEALGKLVQKQVSPMRTTVTPSNYRRQVAAALARRLVRALAEQEPTKASAPGPTPASTVDLEPAREERVSATAMTMNAAELLLDGGDPGHAALACGADTLTYAQLRDTVARAAAVWKGLGVVRGDRIAIKLADGIPWVSAFLGAIWAGGVAVGVNPRIPGDDYENILRDGGFRLILAEALEGTPPRLRERVVLLGPWWSAVAVASPVAPVAMEANAPALWTHSSGTSGRPKAVVHAHRFAQHAEDVSAQFLGIRVDDRLFASSKLFFAYPQANSLFAGLKIGATVIVDPQWPTAESVVATIVAQRPTVLFSVPSLYRTLLKEGVAREAVAHGVRICVSAGEALSETLRYEWRRQTGMAIVNGYGASETLVLALVNRGDGDWLTASPGIEVESVAGAGNANPTQISIRGPTLALGYWNRPDADAAHFRDGAFCPSDLFERNAQGQWRFVGRDDALVKIRGRWVNLAELEERLAAASPAVSEAAAVSVQDADGVDAIAFFYVVKPGPPEDVADRLRALAGTLPHYQRPRWLFEIAALPRTATGKLLRRKLRELHRTVA